MNPNPKPSAASSWGPRLRKLRLERGLTLEELAGRVGCTKGYLSGIENSKRDVPSDEIVEALEKALSLPPGQLARTAGWERTPAHVRRDVIQLAAREAAQREREKRLAAMLKGSELDATGRLRGPLDEAYRTGELHRMVGAETDRAPWLTGAIGRLLPREVPLINQVAAGYPTEFTDLGYPARIADEYVRAPDVDDADAFAARVVGDSMMPEYREGDIVVFSPVREVKSGMDCFARLDPDGETTFKRVFFEEGEKTTNIRLQPLNPAYSARVFPRERVAGLYAAVSVIKKLL